jgi:hypothetical protein
MRKASELSIETKLKIVRSDVEPFLLCVYETWEVANKITRVGKLVRISVWEACTEEVIRSAKKGAAMEVNCTYT